MLWANPPRPAVPLLLSSPSWPPTNTDVPKRLFSFNFPPLLLCSGNWFRVTPISQAEGDLRRFSVLYLFFFFFQPEIIVNALIPFKDGIKRFGSAGSLCPIFSGFWSPLEVISLNNTLPIKILPPLCIPLCFSKSYFLCSTVFSGRGLISDVKM